jgi:FMN phosphatase YigB (HAD superfamily)
VPGTSQPYRAVFLDALGTTVRLLPPWERIDPALVEGLPPERIRSAFRTEMSFYAAHAHEATDPDRLASLRATCAELLSEGLGRPVGIDALMASIAFEAYEDAGPVLDELRGMGLRLVCVSNWDCDLPAVLERVGLADRFDAVVASALAGSRKPDPAIFERALELADCAREEALHVGDSADDVEGARAAGIAVLLIDREGGAGDIASLREVPSAVRAGPPRGAIGQDPAR